MGESPHLGSNPRLVDTGARLFLEFISDLLQPFHRYSCSDVLNLKMGTSALAFTRAYGHATDKVPIVCGIHSVVGIWIGKITKGGD